jgi:hypothetical protein
VTSCIVVVQELQRQLYIARKDETEAGDHDAEMRELYVTQIQCYARESMDELDLISQVTSATWWLLCYASVDDSSWLPIRCNLVELSLLRIPV